MSTIAPPAPLTIEGIDDEIALVSAMNPSPHGSFRPFAERRVQFAELIGVPLADRDYSPHAWLAILRRARKALKSRI